MDRLPALADARSSLLAAFVPAPSAANFNAPQRDVVSELFREMTLVERAGAWRALGALSGQMLELHIRQFMIQAGVTQNKAEKMALAALLTLAEDRNLLAIRKPGVSTLQSMTTARRLRNMASHGSPSQPGPTELRATQSLLLLVALSARLFPPEHPTFLTPKQVDLDWVRANHADADPDLLTTFFGENPQHVDDELLRSIFRQVTRHGSLWSIYKLGKKLMSRRHTLAQDMHSQCFGDIAIRSASAQPLVVARVVRLLGSCFLNGQARALRVLLPMDADALSYFISNTPGSVVTYISLCDRTDKQLFRDAFKRPEDVTRFVEVLARHSGRLPQRKSVGVPNFARMIDTLPLNVRMAFFQVMSRGDLLENMQSKSAADCLTLAGITKGVGVEQAEKITNDLLRLASQRAANESFALLCRLVWTLEESPILSYPEARLAVGMLVSRCLMPEHVEDAPYVLWRIAQLGPDFESMSMLAVAEVATRVELTLGVRARISALRSIANEHGFSLSDLADQSEGVIPRTEVGGFDRWDLFLLVVGFHVLGLEEQRAKISRLIPAELLETPVRGEISRRLLRAAVAACKHNRNDGPTRS